MQLFEEHVRKLQAFAQSSLSSNAPADILFFDGPAPVANTVEALNVEAPGSTDENSASFKLTDEEKMREDGIALLNSLIQSADDEKGKCKQQCDDCIAKRTELIKEKEDKSQAYDQIEKKDKDLEAEINGLLTYNQELGEEANRLASEINDLQVRINNANEKLQYASKWCWVPGYGLYVAIDCATDSDVQHLASLSSQKQLHAQAYEDNLRSLNELSGSLQQESSEDKRLAKELLETNIALDGLQESITVASLNAAQWDIVQDQYRALLILLKTEDIPAAETIASLNAIKVYTDQLQGEYARAFTIELDGDREGFLKDGLVVPGGGLYITDQKNIKLFGQGTIPYVRELKFDEFPNHAFQLGVVYRGCPCGETIIVEFTGGSGIKSCVSAEGFGAFSGVCTVETPYTSDKSDNKPMITAIHWRFQ
jgi:hypothetical protein